MAVDFLTVEQKASYGQFSGEPNEVQLARYFHLDEIDIVFILERRGKANRLGVALQLGCVRFLGTFLFDLSQVPTNVQWFVARQLGITDITVVSNYAQRETTRREHSALIRKKYQYYEFTWPSSFRLSRLLYTRSWISNERPSLLFDLATGWLIQHKILLPGVSTLTRLISEVRERASNRLWLRLSELPTSEQVVKLETLLQVPEGSRASRFDQLRKGPVTVSGPAFNDAIERYLELKTFGMQVVNFAGIPPVRFKSLARHAGMISVYKIARMPEKKRTAILVAFAKAYQTIALDEALDVLDLLITSLAGTAKKLGQKKRLRTLKDLDRSALALADACSFIVNDSTQDEALRSSIFAKVSKKKLTEFIEIVQQLARPFDDNFHDEMVEQYGRVRRFLPALLNDIEFKAAPAGTTTLSAFHYLADLLDSRKQILDDAPQDIITNAWKRLVFDKDGRITKRGYTLCFLDKLQDGLRRRDIYEVRPVKVLELATP